MKTQYSRRELYALGEPLGESSTRIEVGRRVYGGGGGVAGMAGQMGNAVQGAAPTPTSPNVTNPQAGLPMSTGLQTPGTAPAPFSNATSTATTSPTFNPNLDPMSQTEAQQGIAGYAQPYVNTMLGATMQNLFDYDQYGNATGMRQYTPYSYNPADYFAGFSPLQQQAQYEMAGLQDPYQTQQASRYANQAIRGLMNQQYNPQTGGYMSVQGSQADAAQLGAAPMATAQDATAQNMQAYNMGASPAMQAAQFQGPAALQAQNVAAERVNAPQLQALSMQAAKDVGSQDFTQPGTAASYMNPYTQNVVDIQKREAQRQAGIAGTQRGAQAARAGAFGGSRQAIENAEAQRNLATQMGDIQAQGQNAAYQNAMQQFNADQARQLQANLANQGNQQQANLQNLSAGLQTQGLGAQTGLQAQQLNQATGLQALLANQQAGLTAGQANQNMAYNTAAQNAQLAQQAGLANQALAGQYGLQQGQFGQNANVANQNAQNQFALANQQARNQFGLANQALAGQYGLQQGQFGQAANLQNAQLAQQANIANQNARQQAQQLAAQQQQFGANYGMQGLQSALSGAGTLGGLGTSSLNNQLARLNAQQATGLTQQQQQQNMINQAVQNYQTAQQYPMTQLGQMKNMLSGLPVMSTSTQSYQAPPSTLQQMLALGMGGAGIDKMTGGALSGAIGAGLGSAGDAISKGWNSATTGIGNWWNNATAPTNASLGLDFFNKGGSVKGYKEGGVTSEENVASIANFLPTQQLPRSFQMAQSRGDVDAETALQKEMAERASIQRGLGGAFNQLPQGTQQNVIRAAGGGVVAFAKGGLQSTLADLTAAGEEDVSATPEQRMQGIQALAPQVQAMYGPSQTAKYAEEIEQERADLKSGKNKDQAYGMGLLKAAQAVLKPGGVMRGLGDAGAVFGEEVMKMEKENREANRMLRQSQITLAAADQARADGQIGKATELYNQGQAQKEKALDRRIGVLEKKATIEGGVEQAKIHAASAAAGHENTDFKSLANSIYAAKIESGLPANAATRASANKEAADQWGKLPGSARAEATAGKDRIKVAEAVDMMLMKPGVEKERYRELQAADKAGGTNKAAEYRRSLIDQEMGVPAAGGKGGPAPVQTAPQPKAQTPDLNTWMAAARKANPGVSDADLKAYYSSNYK